MRHIYGKLMSDEDIMALMIRVKRDWPPREFEEDPLLRSARGAVFDAVLDTLCPPVIELDGVDWERVGCPACGDVGYRHENSVVHVWSPADMPVVIERRCWVGGLD